MGVYADYLNQGLGGNFERLTAERKKQLQRISALRSRDVLVFAAALGKGRVPTAINYLDLLPLHDQLSQFKNSGNSALDLILETPGGSGEVVEDIVEALRARYETIGVIVPGAAKSAGTILAMAADEILMDDVSALGPIDAQIIWQGKQFSAHALLEGMERIKKEVVAENALNRAYVPILQNISPGELQNARNALDFAKELVTGWLATHKFKNWTVHSSSGQPVTDESRLARATQIADDLCDHGRWKTHGRSLKIDDLRGMKLLITDYRQTPDLHDAIRRYHALTQMTLETNIYKMYETPSSQIYKSEAVQSGELMLEPFGGAPAKQQTIQAAQVAGKCPKCGTVARIEARFTPNAKISPGTLPFPINNLLKCPQCDYVHDLTKLRSQIEAQTKRKIV